MRVSDGAGHPAVGAEYFNGAFEMSNPIKMRIRSEPLTKAADN